MSEQINLRGSAGYCGDQSHAKPGTVSVNLAIMAYADILRRHRCIDPRRSPLIPAFHYLAV